VERGDGARGVATAGRNDCVRTPRECGGVVVAQHGGMTFEYLGPLTPQQAGSPMQLYGTYTSSRE
jgi:hypothetical protein